ncbi:MAG: VOC family protein [Actinomycetota bacterium]|nr:VOC family protein [Actinomycetota bacterium]
MTGHHTPGTVVELGHVVLYVRDLDTSRAFYADVLGWPVAAEVDLGGARAVAFSAGRTHHELLLIEVGPSAAPLPAGRRVGMYHFGVKVGDSDDDLRAALGRLHDRGVTVVGASDHTITHSLYLQDPDGNEVELYVDVPGVDWHSNPEAILAPIRPLHL